jgi:hypothetical protein
MAYYPRSALSNLVNKTTLESETSIELLRLHHRNEEGRSMVDEHGTFGDDILHRISTSKRPSSSGVNIQLL